MIIAATGHRPKYLGNEYNLDGPYSQYIREELQKIIDKYKPTQMISGMALGVDTIWAELAILNKIPLMAAIPFFGQESRWKRKDQKKYHELIQQAYRVNVSSDRSDNKNFYEFFIDRDKWMVDHCHLLVAVLLPNKKSGGTYYTVKYAKKENIKIIKINPKGWENVVSKKEK